MANTGRRASLSHCAVDTCSQPIFKRGYCVDHYRTFNDAANGPSAAKPANVDLPESKIQDNRGRFKELTAKPIDNQVEFFLKSFIFDLGDNWKELYLIQKAFVKRLSDANEGKPDLNPIMAADFLQKNGLERTAVQRKDEILDIDLDNNNRIALIEYLLLHYKPMILAAYYKRKEQDCPFDLSKGGVGITGVGPQLLDELFTLPIGLDPELIAAIEEFTQKKKAREAKIKELQDKAGQGGVKGLAAANEIKQIETADMTDMNRIEITLAAAKRRAGTRSGDVALKKKQQQQEEEERLKREASRNKLKGMAAKWEQNK
jgi:hypothetical protein